MLESSVTERAMGGAECGGTDSYVAERPTAAVERGITNIVRQEME